ncbi:von Willebrand factor A domain-containing protein 1-like [Brachyhypopomus gauderio]|uniref:von Willebrand factor A domain-containing protein 1-like n=1 Tax=Brachyhypopomus gauderio TaxID=698409 RepID=UPI0040435E5E
MKCLGAACLVVLSACLQSTCPQNTAPGPVLDCCEGDILILLDSSGSVSSYEFSNLLHFLVDLLHPFLLGRGQVRVGLVQVHTKPKVEFGFDTYNTQQALQGALLGTRQLHGETNNEGALLLAQRLLETPPGHEAPPRVLLWLTDGVELGNVDRPIAALHQEGVSVLAVSMGHSGYQVLRKAVTPPIEAHLHFVDAEDISIITEDLREAIIELIRAEHLQVRDVTSHSAILQWRPLLIGGLGRYELRYGPDMLASGPGMEQGRIRTLSLPGEHTWAQLPDLQPNTAYRTWLIPHTEQGAITGLTANFRTLPDVLTPTTVSVSESGPDQVHVSWGPLLAQVHQYRVEYGPIPHGDVRTVILTGRENNTLLTQLQPDTHYLITVIAVHASGQERAMSVRACTQEVLPGLADLQLTSVGLDSVKVDWRAWSEGVGLQGYWVRWEEGGQSSSSSSSSSSRYLPAHSLSTILKRVSPASRVCVSPVYRTARGEGLCCTVHTHTVPAPWE